MRLLRMNRYVTLKIIKSKLSNSENLEATFLPDSASVHPGKRHVQETLDYFTIKGPNGQHSCIVLEPLGRNLEMVLDKALELSNEQEPSPNPCDPKNWLVRFSHEVCKHLVLGLDFLHSQCIMHRDIQPGNLMLALTYDLDAMTEDQIQGDVWDRDMKANLEVEVHSSKWSSTNFALQHEYTNIIKRLNGEPAQENDIKYTVGPVHLHDRLFIDDAILAPFRVVLADLGGACRFEDANNGQLPYPLDVRSPQVILGLPIDEKADIWALGLTLFRIVTLSPLITAYVSWTEPNRQETNDEQLTDMVKRLGPIPDTLRSKWPNAHKFVDSDGNLLTKDDEYGPESFWYGDIGHAARIMKPKDMSDADVEVFVSFIRPMLEWDPAKRPSTADILKHPWLTKATETQP